MQNVIEAICTCCTGHCHHCSSSKFGDYCGNNAAITTTASIFAKTPSQQKVDNVINYIDKIGLSLWKAADEALPTKVDMMALGMVTFVEGMKAKV